MYKKVLKIFQFSVSDLGMWFELQYISWPHIGFLASIFAGKIFKTEKVNAVAFFIFGRERRMLRRI